MVRSQPSGLCIRHGAQSFAGVKGGRGSGASAPAMGADPATGTSLSGVCTRNREWNLERRRRVVVKAEHIDGKSNPRFVVTSVGAEAWAAQQLYEDLYCARGDMGVSREGHIYQLVRDQPGLKDSSPVAGEASWRESKATEPSDNILE